MALDPYALCPCGNGKKLKFCECHTESAEIEKALIAIDGEQRLQALDICNRILATKPKHMAMLGLKASVQLAMNDVTNAEKTIAEFLGAAPKNPFALALQATIDLYNGRVNDAVKRLQTGLIVSENQVHAAIMDGFLSLGSAFDRLGRTMAARAHLGFHAAVMRDGNSQAMRMLVEIDRDPETSLYLKNDVSVRPPGLGAAYRDELEAANKDFNKGLWLQAATKYEAIDKRYPNKADILTNWSAALACLGDPKASDTFRKAAHAPDQSPDEAIALEAIAQELAGEAGETQIDVLRIVYKLKDAAALLERLTSAKNAPRAGVDPNRLAQEGQAPPRAVHLLLDKPPVAEGEEVELSRIPRVIGEFLVYGKETDRDARLEFVVPRDADMLQNARALQQVCGDQLGMIDKEEVIGKQSAETIGPAQRWYAMNVPADRVRELQMEQLKANVLEAMPTIKMKLLDGKTMRETAADPAYRIRVAARIARIEGEYRARMWPDVFAELRRSLGLAPEGELDPQGVDFTTLRLSQAHRYDVTKLSDDQLEALYDRTVYMGPADVAKKAAFETTRRPSMIERVALHEVYMALSSLHPARSTEAIEYLDKARQAAVAKKLSPASYLLRELDLRLVRQELDEVSRVMRTIQTRHLNEPGVAEAFYYRLQQLGLIGPDGRPVAAPGPTDAPRANEPAPTAAASTAGVWTPDQGAKPAATAASGSKLWLPGMD